MKTYKELLNKIELVLEAKQVGDLYHYTSIGGAKGILYDNKIIGWNKNISFTRNKNFHKTKRTSNTHISIELDGDKISNNKKVTPFHDKFINNPKRYKNKENSESEETISGNLHNVKDFIKKIRIHKKINNKDLKELQSHNIPIEHVK